MPVLCLRFAQDLPRICPRFTKDLPKYYTDICPRSPLGDFMVKIGHLLHQKSPLKICEYKKIPKLLDFVFLYE